MKSQESLIKIFMHTCSLNENMHDLHPYDSWTYSNNNTKHLIARISSQLHGKTNVNEVSFFTGVILDDVPKCLQSHCASVQSLLVFLEVQIGSHKSHQ